MYELIFRNWKFALLWAVGLTATAAAFMEKDGGQARLQASADQIRAQRELAQPAQAAPATQPVVDQEEADEPADGEAPAEPGEPTDSPA